LFVPMDCVVGWSQGSSRVVPHRRSVVVCSDGSAESLICGLCCYC
jgi:hypothetical protein